MLNHQRFFNKKIIAIVSSLLITVIFLGLLISPSEMTRSLLLRLNYLAYDWRLHFGLISDLKVEHPIVVIDLDTKSLMQEGRWPWPRAVLANLLKNTQQAGAAVVAFDIIFAEAETNMAKAVFDKLVEKMPQQKILLDSIESLIHDFDFDTQFAQQLEQGDSVLGMIFESVERKSIGQLPEPLLKITPELLNQLSIFKMSSYTTAIPILQKNAKNAGFLTIIPDEDGLIRRASLILRLGENIYPALALDAARLYLLVNNVKLNIKTIGDLPTLEGIYLGNYLIPTDEHGQMLIPFGDLARKIKTISAIDVLHNNIPPKLMENALVFVGSSDITMGDLKATPLYGIYSGVKMQALMAAGILYQQVAYQPEWAAGLEFVILLIVGLLLSLILPFMSAIWLVLTTFTVLSALIVGDIWLWQHAHIDLPLALPSLLVFLLGSFNMTYGFISERAHSRQLKSIFDQYVPPAHIDEMLKGKDTYGFEGESREMSVLFADIRHFTTISENLSVAELKKLLNQFFTKITDVILEHDGTIDKYIGDMVMAFWGAPLRDPKHPHDAVAAALDMQTAAKALQPIFAEMKLPKIEMGVGVNTGMMNVGDMGSTFRRNYTVLGDAVNLGSRLESITKFYKVGIIVSEFTKARCENIIFRRLDRIRVKGKQQAIDIFEPLCFKKESTPEIEKEVQQCERLLSHYFAQEWEDALSIAEILKKIHPGVYLYQLYEERIIYLSQNPPSANWDGVYSF